MFLHKKKPFHLKGEVARKIEDAQEEIIEPIGGCTDNEVVEEAFHFTYRFFSHAEK